ncbi:response regulator [Clostridium minihomine]|uniref:response regulator n=1 Tax=Clostridium minihomine TaxID=2045012 RepID=UPI000C79546E|nr:response regulator [Clostridium minihomine]
MNFYIVEDDVSVINNLEDIIESNNLGNVCGSSGEKVPNPAEIIASAPDVVLVDFLMPNVDGIQVVSALRELGCTAKCIMISQVSNKELIMKAYNAGVDFFISKPINVIEIKRVIENITRQIQMEHTLSNIRKMFQAEVSSAPEREDKDIPVRKLQYILNQLGMSGEKGSKDILTVCQYLYEQDKTSMAEENIGKLCEILSDNPKSMEQRIRRAIAKGMSNLANLGIEDFMNDTFTRYSSTLFSFEGIKTEMDFIRGKRASGGKINIKKFINGLLIFMDQ